MNECTVAWPQNRAFFSAFWNPKDPLANITASVALKFYLPHMYVPQLPESQDPRIRNPFDKAPRRVAHVPLASACLLKGPIILSTL